MKIRQIERKRKKPNESNIGYYIPVPNEIVKKIGFKAQFKCILTPNQHIVYKLKND